MNFVMASPVWGRDARLTEVFAETATWLARGNVAYALVRYRETLKAAMAPQRNWISFDDEMWLREMGRWQPKYVFEALALQFWMPANVRALSAHPEKEMGSLLRNSRY